jgi:hypothetical protein
MKKIVYLLAFIACSALLICSGCDSSGGDGNSGCGSAERYPIEEKYAARGSWQTTVTSIEGYDIYHPVDLGRNGFKHPIVTWGNGTGATPDDYSGLLTHMASHGFIVIASRSTQVASGKEMLEGVAYMTRQNDNPASIFFGHLDIDAVGATGHSQGARGTLNSASSPLIKAICPMEPGPIEPESIVFGGPMFLIGGAADNIVVVDELVVPIFEASTVPTIMGILDGATHFTPTGDGGGMAGYVTAWFAAQLMDDEFAKGAFYGACEICSHGAWEVKRKHWVE